MGRNPPRADTAGVPTATAAPSTARITGGRRLSDESLLTVWMRYRSTGDRALRDRLVLSLSPLVKYVVSKKVREVPGHLELDDFLSCGLEALIRCIDRFDPAKGATLEQFAYTRVHGAVLDELRRQDWAPRSVRRLERDVAKVRSDFRILHGRDATEQEAADAAGITVAELRGLRDDLARADRTSLNQTIRTDGSEVERADTLASDDLDTDPEHHVVRREGHERFREAFARLSHREQQIATMLYVEHLTGAEVGRRLGVTESRISQIHSALRSRLRSELAEHDALFVG